jgi:uncharacterized membrane protein YagU involved in acid resistance
LDVHNREITMDIKIGQVLLAGIIGTMAMTAVGLWVAPLMGMPPMNPAVMLAGAMGGNMALGWMAHFLIGIILAAGYAVIGPRFPGPGFVRGALYGIIPFFMAQLLVMPMMRMPLFSGSVAMAMGSLVGHLVYGGFVGAVYGEASEVRVAPAAV